MTSPDLRTLLRTAGPHAAIEQLKKDVRQAPRDPRLRTFLFQLFCIFAEWDRALTQLTVVSELDPLALPMAQAYRATIRCEMLRERVFAGSRTPTVLGKPDQWLSLLIEANRVLASGAADKAADLRDAAFEAAPVTTGTITVATGTGATGTAATGTGATGRDDATTTAPFAWIADADQRLGPILEAIVDGKYYWVPFDRLHRLDLEAPADLRDQVWMPAHFTWSNGGETDGFIPSRYPGSATAGEDLAMARRTEWRSASGMPATEGDSWLLGLGQRTLATDADEVPLLDLRRLDVTAAPPA